PELANADTREERRGDDTLYTFARRIGTKGGGRRRRRPPDIAGILRRVPSRELRVFELAIALLLPDGTLDIDAAGRCEPELEPAILNAGKARGDRDAERVWAFCSAFEQRYFPLYECEEPEQLLYCIGFVRLGWSYEAFHDLDLRPGTLLLRALCAEPYESSLG